MLLTQRFIVHQSKQLNLQVPEKPDEITDQVFLRLTAICGGHERAISVARCFRLTNSSLNNLHKCVGLQHLNLSYTNIFDISPIKHCTVLRTLNISGLQCSSFEDLKWLYSLELLGASFSSFSDLSPLRELSLLRSLDLGHTHIDTVENLEHLTRLELLMLDSTPKMTLGSIPGAARCFEKLENLKLLNIGDSALEKGLKNFAPLLPPTASIMTKPRRVQWFESIINNDHETVRKMVWDGQDVNMRASLQELELFTYYYLNRCKRSTVYFDCQSPKEEYRPAGAHVAILFNSKESLAHIAAGQCEESSSVWLGRMEENEDPFDDSDREWILSDEDGENSECPCYSRTEKDMTPEKASPLKSQMSDTDNSGRCVSTPETLPVDKERRIITFRRQSVIQVNSHANAASEGDKEDSNSALNRKVLRRTILRPQLPAAAATSEAAYEKVLAQRVVYTLHDLIEKVYDAGIHRVTERMVERRVTGWKKVAREIADELLKTIGVRHVVTTIDAEIKKKNAETLRLKKEKKMRQVAAVEARHDMTQHNSINQENNNSISNESLQDMAELENQERNRGDTVEDRPMSSNSVYSTLHEGQISVQFDRSQQVSRQSVDDNNEGGERGTTDFIHSPDTTKDYADCADGGHLNVDPYEFAFSHDIKGTVKPEGLHTPGLQEIGQYDVMIDKLVNIQTAVVSNELDSAEETVELLGPKDFFNEGRALDIRRRAREEEDRDAENSYNSSRSSCVFGGNHPLSRTERIRMLKATIKERQENMVM